MIGVVNTIAQFAKESIQEFKDFERFYSAENNDYRRLVFYAESSIFYRYYEDYIEYILQNSKLGISYITSQPDDEIFKLRDPHIRPFYFKHMLSAVFRKLDSKVLVLANPDLNNSYMKRAPDPVQHVLVFRGISSTHQGYRTAAFDHYDCLLCVGQYQIDEIRKREELYKLRAKELILTGYPLAERLQRQYQIYEQSAGKRQRKLCLIAPTWAPMLPESSIMDNCIETLIEKLKDKPFDVWIRPHPEYLKRNVGRINNLRKLLAATANVSLQTDLSSMECLFEADVLITDHSSIAIDYSLATGRPVVYIDTPTRTDNPEWQKLGLEPVENAYRDKLGKRLALSEVGNIAAEVEYLLDHPAEFSAKIPQLRDELVAHWQCAAEVGGRHILKLCGEE